MKPTDSKPEPPELSAAKASLQKLRATEKPAVIQEGKSQDASDSEEEKDRKELLKALKFIEDL